MYSSTDKHVPGGELPPIALQDSGSQILQLWLVHGRSLKADILVHRSLVSICSGESVEAILSRAKATGSCTLRPTANSILNYGICIFLAAQPFCFVANLRTVSQRIRPHQQLTLSATAVHILAISQLGLSVFVFS